LRGFFATSGTLDFAAGGLAGLKSGLAKGLVFAPLLSRRLMSWQCGGCAPPQSHIAYGPQVPLQSARRHTCAGGFVFVGGFALGFASAFAGLAAAASRAASAASAARCAVTASGSFLVQASRHGATAALFMSLASWIMSSLASSSSSSKSDTAVSCEMPGRMW